MLTRTNRQDNVGLAGDEVEQARQNEYQAVLLTQLPKCVLLQRPKSHMRANQRSTVRQKQTPAEPPKDPRQVRSRRASTQTQGDD
jgi:hypothetical protein